MTKFEEELFYKVPCKFEITTEAEYKKSTLINHFKNWHSDEEFQELLDKYSNLNDNYEKEVIKSSKLESQIIGLKSQLQQQALPVVPECVGNFLSGKSIFKIANGDIPDDVISWVQEQTYYVDLEKIISHLISLKVTGYQVEKPQQNRYEVKLLSGESMYFNPIGNSKNIKDYRFSFGNYAGWKTQFTKSELSEIKNGMFLKRIPGGTPLDDLGKDKSYYVWLDDCNYWINPLIELVPVEDGE
ncbi:DUF1642 domain-containing protein [Lactococcus lactis]|uniref:DUF1642 domain-containing protein n=1 Tax=Lactococcus lactis TaxID=1358 RepID=UPI003D1178D6